MLLILCDRRLDRRQFINLMSDRSRIVPRQRFAAASARRRSQRNYRITFFCRDQFALVARMPFLTTTALPALGFVTKWLCMRVNTAWRNGRVLRRQLLDLGLEIRNLSIQIHDLCLQNPDLRLESLNKRMNEGANRRSHLGVDFGRDQRMRRLAFCGHDKLCRVPNAPSKSRSVSKFFSPTRERLRKS